MNAHGHNDFVSLRYHRSLVLLVETWGVKFLEKNVSCPFNTDLIVF